MARSPALFSSAPESSGVSLTGAGEIGHCGRCRFAGALPVPVWHFSGGRMVRSADVYCGAFDRRVTPVGGCSKFLRVGGHFQPHPLEH